ncbi:hypothetical protein E5329_20625 [Petralouisia muris]|jgi:hypothetical protein|uniref:Uncharacterized protein n=1 Tax=Petralouisia muris TaxID=3032872 RepID=A0AC61RR67_9FIRM|nr:YceG family protein [Petralouisia muris]TGY91541.1 hypothetical protein E5329_20625 [Petralouisia muris]
MLKHRKLQSLDEYFLEPEGRRESGVFFYRICGYNQEIHGFIRKYYDAARTSGVVIEGRIPNPEEKQLDYYGEIMGMDFQMSTGFLLASLKKWLPRMKDYQREQVSLAIYDTLDGMRRAGKNENMMKNAYIKFMCWLYYKFERVVNQLEEHHIPKILYEGEISNYELKLMAVLSRAGCDIVLLQYHGDENYLKLDVTSELSFAWNGENMTAFPKDFSLKGLREEVRREQDKERLYGPAPGLLNCTNAWIQGKGLTDIKTELRSRGSNPGLFYNCFIRINGVEDKLTYLNELFQFQLELKNSGRKLVIADQEIPKPTMEEISGVVRKNYAGQNQMLADLAANNLKYAANPELQRLMYKAFLDIMLEEAKHPGMNLNKLTNKAVYLICWLKRYQSELFYQWKIPEIGCFIYLGGCKTENEGMFLKVLARLPVDVLILAPDLNRRCCLEDSLLYEVNYPESLTVDRFPQDNSGIRMGTAAYHAERELDTIMYQDSGLYRNRQYGKANAVTLQTMYEEIELLWDQELKYRPNFSTVDEVVNLPVIYAKISGVKLGISEYWSGIKRLVTGDTVVSGKVPYISSAEPNPIKPYVTEFFKNGKLQRAKIKGHSGYPYGFLREEIQEHILDKLQLLIEQRIIKGTFENGMEYTIIAVVLNLKKEILRMIQKFDFTKRNPKFLYINTTEAMITLEDSILVSFLNLAGFDVLFLVPTGYQSIEKYLNKKLMEEHQIGEYMYDLQVPDFGRIPSNARQSWRDKIFKRGS